MKKKQAMVQKSLAQKSHKTVLKIFLSIPFDIFEFFKGLHYFWIILATLMFVLKET